MDRNDLGTLILDCAFKVHRKLGPGLLESTYETCLEYELIKEGLHVERQKVLPLIYEDLYLDKAYRIDLLINNDVIIEIKATDIFHKIYMVQLRTYMRLMDVGLGYLINFNVPLFKGGD